MILHNFKNTYFEEFLQIAVNNNSEKYNNYLFCENKAPAPTGIRKDNSWIICQLSLDYTSKYLYLLNESDLSSALCFHVTCIGESNVKLRVIKFFLHIRAEAPNKGLTSDWH